MFQRIVLIFALLGATCQVAAMSIRIDQTLAACTVNPSGGAVAIAIGNYNFQGMGADDCFGGTQLSPFSVNIGGTLYNSLYQHNDGLVTFGSSATPIGSILDAGFGPAIAPFMTATSYLDSVSAGTPRISYGGTAFTSEPYLSLNYESGNSGSYYQMNLIDRSGATGVVGDFDIELNYATFDDDSGPTQDQGGAQVGFNNGAGQAYALPGSGVAGAFLGTLGNCGTPSASPLALACNSFGTTVGSRYLFSFRNGVAINLTPPTAVPAAGVFGLLFAGLLIVARRRYAGS
ncbi:MAG: hypothetical protein AAF513_04125 [Pseudomonadota bacterium]